LSLGIQSANQQDLHGNPFQTILLSEKEYRGLEAQKEMEPSFGVPFGLGMKPK